MNPYNFQKQQPQFQNNKKHDNYLNLKILQKNIHIFQSSQSKQHKNKEIQGQLKNDYNFKQLQYTKNRQYKQNLNPLFQLMQTTTTYPYDNIKTSKHYKKQMKISFNSNQIENSTDQRRSQQRKYDKIEQKYNYLQDSKNRDFNSSKLQNTKYNMKYINDSKRQYDRNSKNIQLQYDEKNQKQDKINYYRQRSRILSQNIKVKQKQKTKHQNSKKIAKQNFFSFGQNFSNKYNQVLYNPNNQQQTYFSDGQEDRILSINIKKLISNKENQDFPLKIQSNNNNQECPQNQRQKLSQQYIEKLKAQVIEIQKLTVQNQEKMMILRKQVQMHKQKNLLKQKQIFLLQKQKKLSQRKHKNLSKQLQYIKQKTTQIQTQYHQNNKQLKNSKRISIKQQAWLQQQSKQFDLIKQKYQKLLTIVNDLQHQQSKRQQFWKQLQQQASRHQQFRSFIQDLQTKIQQLQQENKVLDQQTSTLQVHEQQLFRLQNKFKDQTQNIIQSISNVQQQIKQKQQYINSQDDLENMIKQLQLQIGQISSKKIILDQEIYQINHQIDLKKRNIRHIQKSSFDHKPKRQSQKMNKAIVNKQYPKNTNCQQSKINQYQSMKNEFNTKNNQKSKEMYDQQQKEFKKSKSKQNQLLSTIKEQSKNTSAYQSPKQQTYIQQQEYKNNLELHSNLRQRTQILNSQQQINKNSNIQNSEHKLKKYLVVDSQEDVNSGLKSSNFLKQKNSQEYFIQRQKHPSIQHRLIDIERQRSKNHKSAQLSPYKKQYRNSTKMNQTYQNQIEYSRKSNRQKMSKKSRQQQSSGLQNSSDQVFQSLISRYQQIKSKSYFDQKK